MITLISNDNIHVNITKDIITKSGLLQDFEDNSIISLNNMTGSQLLFIHELCLSSDPILLLMRKTPGEQIDILKDVSYLVFDDLVEICCKAIVNNIKGCSSEQIKIKFTR